MGAKHGEAPRMMACFSYQVYVVYASTNDFIIAGLLSELCEQGTESINFPCSSCLGVVIRFTFML